MAASLGSAARRVALIASVGALLAGSLVHPGPVAAAWARTLTIAIFQNATVGDGRGTVTSDDGGINCSWDAGVQSGDCSEPYVLPDFVATYDVTLTLDPGPGSYVCLIGVLSCSTGGATQTYPIRFERASGGDFTMTPSFSLRTYPVEVAYFGPGTVSSGGTVCSPTSGYAYCRLFKYGSSATLTAVPQSGSTFGGWLDEPCMGEGAVCTFTVSGANALGAVFDKWIISYETGAGGEICSTYGFETCLGPSGGRGYILANKGEALTFKAKPNSGWHFDRWSTGPCSGKGSTCSFAASASGNVKSLFEQGPAPTPKPTPAPTPKPTAKPTPRPTPRPTTTAPTPARTALPTLEPSIPPTATSDPQSTAASSDPPGANSTPAVTAVATAPAGQPSPAPSTGAIEPGSASMVPGPLLAIVAILVVGTLLIGFALGRRRSSPPNA